MSNALSYKGHNVIALGFDKNSGRPFWTLDESVKFINPGIGFNGNNIIDKVRSSFCFNSNDRKIERLKYKYKRIGALVSPPIKQCDPDVIISFNREATYILKECVDIDVPVITMYHFNAEIVLDNDLYFNSLENSECIQTLLVRDVKLTEKILNVKKIVTIPNVVPQYKCSTDCINKTIISVGRIDSKQKRQHYLVHAMNLLKDKFPDWEVEVWGDYEYDKAYYLTLCNFIQKQSLNNIKFCGVSDKITEKMKNASIFAFPSSYEGFPLALTEAMSMGLPSIGFKTCPAVNELIIDGHNGILCDESVEAFASSLEELMLDVEKRIKYGKNAKEDMKAYSSDIIWDRWEQLIEEVVEEYKRRHSK